MKTLQAMVIILSMDNILNRIDGEQRECMKDGNNNDLSPKTNSTEHVSGTSSLKIWYPWRRGYYFAGGM